jgi:flagellar motor switch protein FliM
LSEILSQAEIDALLGAISRGEIDAGEMDSDSARQEVKSFDFHRPSKFSKDQIRTIEMMHESFCRLAQNQLSALLRSLVEIKVVSADQVSYEEFVRSMPVPTLINIVQIEPLEGNAVFQLNLPLAFSVIDRLVGGPGTQRPRLRELTEIEHALMRNVTEVLLAAISEAWSAIVPVTFRFVGAEMNPQFAQVVAPSDMVVLISFEVALGQFAGGMMSLCIPYLVLEPAIGKFSAQSYFSGNKAADMPGLPEDIADELGLVGVPVAIELGDTELMVTDLLALDVGDVVPLEVPVGADVTLTVGGTRAYTAQPGTRGKRLAVQVTGRIPDDVAEGALA